MRIFVVLLLLSVPALAEPASRLYKQAQRAERQGNDLEAFALLTRAAGLEPQNQKYHLELIRLRGRASQSLAALGRLEQAAALDPGNAYLRARLEAREEDARGTGVLPTAAEVRLAELARPPIELRPAPGRHSFDLRGDARSVFDQVTRAYGVDVVFDSEFTPGVPFRFQLDQATFREAIRALMATTGTFVIPVSDRIGLVAADTAPKRAELEPMMAVLLPIPQVMSVEEANEVGRAVQQTLDIKRLAVDAGRRQVYVRDTVTRVRLASALYREVARRRAEVMLEIELLSVSRSSVTNAGLTTPTGVAVTNLSRIGNAPAPTAAPEATPLLLFGGGDSLFGIDVPGGGVQADWSRSHSQLLTSFRVRATDGLAATMHVGDKFPIVNALFSPIVITDEIRDLQNQGQLRQPFPSFTFEDLGLVLKVTPRVHDSREISLAIEAEFRLLAGPSFNGIPVISTRKLASSVRVREGETSLLSGMIVLQTAKNHSGIAGLAQIPLIGRLFRRNTWQQEKSELLLSITPRLMGLPPAEQFASRVYDTGTDSRPVSPI